MYYRLDRRKCPSSELALLGCSSEPALLCPVCLQLGACFVLPYLPVARSLSCLSELGACTVLPCLPIARSITLILIIFAQWNKMEIFQIKS